MDSAHAAQQLDTTAGEAPAATAAAPIPAPAKPDPRGRRWQSEADFFDRIALRIPADAPIDAAIVERYRASRRPWFNKEFRFRLVGDVRGSSILDVGCGPGDNALLLASYGAHVTGIDISPACIETAVRRAEASGLSDRTRFVCGPLETAELAPRSYDVVWGDGVLHHLIDDLDAVLARLVAAARPGALFVFSEPVSFVRALRHVRRWIPVHTEATPDERPLEPRELAIVRRHVAELQMVHFGILGRVNKLVLRGSYERAPRLQQAFVSATSRADWLVSGLPGFRSLAGEAVLWGRARS